MHTCCVCAAQASVACPGCHPPGLRPSCDPVVFIYCSVECRYAGGVGHRERGCPRRDLGPRHVATNRVLQVGTGPWNPPTLPETAPWHPHPEDTLSLSMLALYNELIAEQE